MTDADNGSNRFSSPRTEPMFVSMLRPADSRKSFASPR